VTSPAVSVVVPNYNHAQFLERRLDSIYGQTFTDFEVLLLDDASDDESIDILKRYAERHARNTRLILKERNSRSPFAQWAKGIELARGNLVWIAESDDYCELDLLEHLRKPFAYPRVALSYAIPVSVDHGGTPISYQFAEYASELPLARWQSSYVAEAEEEVAVALGLRNTIPNASAALFRREAALPFLKDPIWQRMRICGDWCFYLKLLQGRRIAFVKEARSYFTHTETNTSAREARTKALVAEHMLALATIGMCYPSCPTAALEKNLAFLEGHFRHFFGDNFPEGLRGHPALSLISRKRDLELSERDRNRIFESRSWRYTAWARRCVSLLCNIRDRVLYSCRQ
jgi:glycosyltransferase involved in cell wall biosynthesis